MMTKKAAATLGGVFISLLLVFGLFFGLFGFLSSNYESANVAEDTGLLNMNESLSTWQDNLSSNIDEIEVAARGINEADASIFQVAWNGLTGLATTIRVFFNVINIATGVWQTLVPGLNFVPTWVIVLVELGLVIWIILLIIGAFKGEAKT